MEKLKAVSLLTALACITPRLAITSSASSLDSEQSAFLVLINNYRAQNGAVPLQTSQALQNSAQWMSTDMATKNYFSHTDSLGRDPFTRMAAFGYPYTSSGENIAAGTSTAQQTFTLWQTACDADAKGVCTYAHRQNMLNASFKVIGIGRAYGASSIYQWYWTADFGGVVDQTINTGTAPAISLSSAQGNFTYTSGSAAPSPQVISISNSGGGTLSWTASSNASWLALSSSSGTAPSTITISVNPTGLSPGSYRGTITLTATGATNSPQTISVTLTVTQATSSPIFVTSVANSASGASGAVSPGEIVTINGRGLGPAVGVSFSVDPATGMLDSILAGTQVFFNGLAAPITYTSASQINAIIPHEIAGQSQVVMLVQYQGAQSGVTLLQVAAAAPGVFTFNATGTGQAVAANRDGSFNGPLSPAVKGSYVTIYFTGGGSTNPLGLTGSVNGSTLKWLTQSIQATVGGVPATVQFDGAAPGLVDGVGQLNIQLSENTPSGPAQPLVVTVGGVSSPATATLGVQ